MKDYLENFAKEKVQSIDMAQLRESNIPRIGGNAFQNGIRHFDLFERVQDIFEQGNFQPKMENIYVAASREATPGVETSEELERTYGVNHIKTFTFRKILTKINLNSLSDDEKVESLAIGYHQNGLQIAYGPNVKICANMTILGGGHSIIMNSRDSKNDIETVFNIIRGWAKVAPYRWEWENRVISLMKETVVELADMQRLIGLMTLLRISKSTTEAVGLNQGQVNVVGARYLKELEIQRANGQGDNMSLWKVYNMGTAVHNPREMESIENIIPANISFGHTIADYFGIDLLNYNPEGSHITFEEAPPVPPIPQNVIINPTSSQNFRRSSTTIIR